MSQIDVHDVPDEPRGRSVFDPQRLALQALHATLSALVLLAGEDGSEVRLVDDELDVLVEHRAAEVVRLVDFTAERAQLWAKDRPAERSRLLLRSDMLLDQCAAARRAEPVSLRVARTLLGAAVRLTADMAGELGLTSVLEEQYRHEREALRRLAGLTGPESSIDDLLELIDGVVGESEL